MPLVQAKPQAQKAEQHGVTLLVLGHGSDGLPSGSFVLCHFGPGFNYDWYQTVACHIRWSAECEPLCVARQGKRGLEHACKGGGLRLVCTELMRHDMYLSVLSARKPRRACRARRSPCGSAPWS
uniref:Uncharacterized protein n=1 Tax=Eutreptiella gymnastica TaxID=73025 RepID=A0A7S4CWP1_9EUGL